MNIFSLIEKTNYNDILLQLSYLTHWETESQWLNFNPFFFKSKKACQQSQVTISLRPKTTFVQ